MPIINAWCNFTLQSCRLLTHSTCCFSQKGSGLRAQTAARWLDKVICTCSVDALSRRQQPWRASINTTTLLLADDPLSPKLKPKSSRIIKTFVGPNGLTVRWAANSGGRGRDPGIFPLLRGSWDETLNRTSRWVAGAGGSKTQMQRQSTIQLEADRLARQSTIDPTGPDLPEGTPRAVSTRFQRRESPPSFLQPVKPFKFPIFTTTSHKRAGTGFWNLYRC